MPGGRLGQDAPAQASSCQAPWKTRAQWTLTTLSRIPALPPGVYALRAERAGFVTQERVVDYNGTNTLTFTFALPREK